MIIGDSIAISYKGQFECGDGNHVNLKSLCDGVVDCATGTDETVLCGRCINNRYHCAQNNVIRCSLSCAVIGYVPCNGIEDRVACKRLYDSGNFTNLSTSLTSAITSPLLHIGLVLLIGTIVAISFFVQKRKRRKREFDEHSNTNANIYVPTASTSSSSSTTDYYEPNKLEPIYAQLTFDNQPYNRTIIINNNNSSSSNRQAPKPIHPKLIETHCPGRRRYQPLLAPRNRSISRQNGHAYDVPNTTSLAMFLGLCPSSSSSKPKNDPH